MIPSLAQVPGYGFGGLPGSPITMVVLSWLDFVVALGDPTFTLHSITRSGFIVPAGLSNVVNSLISKTSYERNEFLCCRAWEALLYPSTSLKLGYGAYSRIYSLRPCACSLLLG